MTISPPRIPLLLLLACLLSVGFTPRAGAAQSEAIMRQQLQTLVPDAQDVQGFARLRLSKFQPSQDATGADSDYIDLNHDATQWSPGRPSTPKRTGTVSRIRRSFASFDGNYTLSIAVTLCDTPEAAKEEVADFRRAVQSAYHPGTLTGGPRIGDESWYASNNALLLRQGRMMVLVDGDETMAGGRRVSIPSFPPAALESVAYGCLLRASRQPALTGVPAQDTHRDAKGRALPKDALWVAGRAYVPVQEFAKTMGLAGGPNAHAQGLTREQLQALIPDEHDLQGFVRVLPGSDTPSLLRNGDTGAKPPAPAKPVKEIMSLRNDPVGSTPWFSMFSETVSAGAIKRLFESADGTFSLDVDVILCDTPEAAHEQLSHLHWTAGMWKPGRWTGPEMIGDESLALVKNGRIQTLAFRYGRLIAMIEGSRSNRSFMFNRALTVQTMPPAAVEAVAYQIVLRASRQAELVGVPARDARLIGSGQVPPKDALMVGKRVYFPAREFTKATALAGGRSAHAQVVIRGLLQALAPDEQDLLGFTRLRPAGALPPELPLDGRLIVASSPAAQTGDHLQIRAERADDPPYWRQGITCDRIERSLYSDSGLYQLDMTVTLYDTPELAKKDLNESLRTSAGRFRAGHFTSPEAIGDESWFLPQNGKFKTLTFRRGRMAVLVEGSRSRLAPPGLEFPPAAVEAVAYDILLRASRQAKLTGVPAQDTSRDAKGRALPEDALWVAGRAYVPAREFARAMGSR